MIQGTYLKIIETGDRGSVFCPAISENFETLDTHSHNGIDSPLISSKNVAKASITLSSAAWVSTGNDYKQTVTLPGGYYFDTTNIKAMISSGAHIGKEIFPTINKLTPTTFDLFFIFNDVSVKVVIS